MQRWYGKLLGFIAGAALLRFNPLLGAALGLLIGHAFDRDWFARRRRGDNPYAVLGVEPDAPDDEVERAYRRLMALHHPDRQPRGDGGDRAREVNRAYDAIKALRRRR